MIECIFTLDYEIYGNGQGSLRSLVYEPASRLMSIFRARNARFVAFVEAAELEMIRSMRSDEAIDDVEDQVRELHRDGFEIGLHLHPQWYNGRYERGAWVLDPREYNLCTLPRTRISEIIGRSRGYLRSLLGGDYAPLAFRAGNWLLQPTEQAAAVLQEQGFRIDSSVFKGGLQRNLGLDYRPALRNGHYWTFKDDVVVPDRSGALLELPTHTQMVPFWRMLTAKRIGIERKGPSTAVTGSRLLHRVQDRLRLRYPLKFDYCRMTFDELTRMVDAMCRVDRRDPTSFRPLVAIGHTKDLSDYGTVERFLSYLGEKGIRVSTFRDVFARCNHA